MRYRARPRPTALEGPRLTPTALGGRWDPAWLPLRWAELWPRVKSPPTRARLTVHAAPPTCVCLAGHTDPGDQSLVVLLWWCHDHGVFMIEILLVKPEYSWHYMSLIEGKNKIFLNFVLKVFLVGEKTHVYMVMFPWFLSYTFFSILRSLRSV